jgi:hypothetical protein
LVDLGGRRLHLHCTGNGSPAVVVENGSNGFAMDFALVQPEVAKFTQICTYDRAGSAWSDAGPTQLTVLGNLPLIVLGRKQSDMARRQKQLDDLTALSSAGKLIIAEDSGHAIHLYRPDLVVQAIREVVTAARSNKPRRDEP